MQTVLSQMQRELFAITRLVPIGERVLMVSADVIACTVENSARIKRSVRTGVTAVVMVPASI